MQMQKECNVSCTAFTASIRNRKLYIDTLFFNERCEYAQKKRHLGGMQEEERWDELGKRRTRSAVDVRDSGIQAKTRNMKSIVGDFDDIIELYVGIVDQRGRCLKDIRYICARDEKESLTCEALFQHMFVMHFDKGCPPSPKSIRSIQKNSTNEGSSDVFLTHAHVLKYILVRVSLYCYFGKRIKQNTTLQERGSCQRNREVPKCTHRGCCLGH